MDREDYFRRVLLVVGEVRLELWDPMGPYILRAHAVLLLLRVSFSVILAVIENSLERGQKLQQKEMKLFYLSLLVTFVASHPGLLRVPKVYNAVITSNQNLSPSRAYPVIQPVVHRTAVGYVPPFYYTQIAPHFSGPEVTHVPRVTAEQSTLVKSQSDGSGSNDDDAAMKLDKEREETRERSGNEETKGGATGATSKEDSKGKKEQEEEEAPLSFYPNYHSLYYDPYFYTYNTFNPHLIPGTYYVDYQPFSQVAPVPAVPPKQQKISQGLLPGYHEEKKDETPKESIPDVPPPPVPTSLSKNS